MGNFLTNWRIINVSRRNFVESVKIRRGIFRGEIKHVTVIAIVLFACNLTELVLGLPHKASPQR